MNGNKVNKVNSDIDDIVFKNVNSWEYVNDNTDDINIAIQLFDEDNSEINVAITVDEIEKTEKLLKSNKSSGIYRVLSEYWTFVSINAICIMYM